MRPPARWLRRVLLAPLVIVLALGLAATAPVWAILTVALSPFTPGRLRPLRLLWLATVYLLVEAYIFSRSRSGRRASALSKNLTSNAWSQLPSPTTRGAASSWASLPPV